MTGKTLTIAMPDESKMGPKFRALRSDMQKAFVVAYLAGGRPREAMAAAGYSMSSDQVVRVTQSRLLNDENVLAAIHEMSFRYLHGLVPTALAAVTEILNQPSHKERGRTALSILDRTGLQGVSEHRVVVEKEPSMAEILAEFRAACSELGLDPETMLAGIKRHRKSLPAPGASGPVIDAEVVPVEMVRSPSGQLMRAPGAHEVRSPSGQTVPKGFVARKRVLTPPGAPGPEIRTKENRMGVRKPYGPRKRATEDEHSTEGLEDIL